MQKKAANEKEKRRREDPGPQDAPLPLEAALDPVNSQVVEFRMDGDGHVNHTISAGF